MHVVQISDRQVFLDKAAVNSVTCTLAPEVVPEQIPTWKDGSVKSLPKRKADGTVWMVPVLRLYYTMDLCPSSIEDAPTRWTFVETQRVVNQQVSIAGTLLRTLQEDRRYNVHVVTRGMV